MGGNPKGGETRYFPGACGCCQRVYHKSSLLCACQLIEVLTLLFTDDNIVFDSLILSYTFH